jgi:hypothetical protein
MTTKVEIIFTEIPDGKEEEIIEAIVDLAHSYDVNAFVGILEEDE